MCILSWLLGVVILLVFFGFLVVVDSLVLGIVGRGRIRCKYLLNFLVYGNIFLYE